MLYHFNVHLSLHFFWLMTLLAVYFMFFFFLISWKLITLQYCSGFCHTLTWISHGYTCIPHPNPPSHLPLHPIPLGLPSAPGLSTCLILHYGNNVRQKANSKQFLIQVWVIKKQRQLTTTTSHLAQELPMNI